MTKEEAIKRIKEWNLDDDDMEVLSTLIPELKENEDKKIKEEIMHLVMQPTWKTEKEFHRRQELCDWIEKQGEQKQKQYDIDVLEKHITKDSISELAHTVIVRNGWEIVDAKELKPAWSEEDDRHLSIAIQYVFEHGYLSTMNWLKTLKERVRPQPKQGLTEIEQELKKIEENEYVDLGLPSGTLWKSANEDGCYTFDEAVEKFADKLPTKEQWEELKCKCIWVWKVNSYNVIGPNCKSIYLPAMGYRCDTKVDNVGMIGSYWSGTYCDDVFAWDMSFSENHLDMYEGLCNYCRSVRLVK